MGTSRFSQLVCDRVSVGVTDILKEHNLYALYSTAQLESYIDDAKRGLVLDLIATFPGVLQERLVVNERWPATWWDAFKERWYPAWLERRYPVQWKTVKIDQRIYKAVCPHVEISGASEQGPHLRWLLKAQEDRDGTT